MVEEKQVGQKIICEKKTAAILVLMAAVVFYFFGTAAANAKTLQKETATRAIADTFKDINGKLGNANAQTYANIIFEAAKKWGENPFVIAAIIIVESTAKANAYSNGNYGLMQIRWSVHKKDLTKKYPGIRREKDLFKPKENIVAGTEIFSKYRAMSGGDVVAGLKRYAGGASTVQKVNKYTAEIETRYATLSSKRK